MHDRLGRKTSTHIAVTCSPSWLFAFAITLVMGLIVSTRPDGIGTDTGNYRAHFLRMVGDKDYATRFEPAFELVMRIIADLTGSPEIFFGFVYGVLLVAMLTAMLGALHEIPRNKLSMFPLAATGLLLISSWFITGSTNGLRQGMSLGLFYCGVSLVLFRGQWLPGIFLVGISPLFHLSTALLWPVVLVAPVLPLWGVFTLFVVGAAAYTFGVTEYLVFIGSELTGIDAHGWVISYVPEVSRWKGWQADLFAYTVGWAIIYMVGRRLVPQKRRHTIDMALKIYMLAGVPYFVFGFGNFSNRYGVMAWTFLPILHAVWIFTARIDSSLKTTFALVLLIGGIGRYSLYLSGGI